MRTLLRTTLITLVVVFSALMVWSLARNANAAQNVQAAPGTTIPPNCVSEVLAGLRERESRTTSAEGRKALHDKEQAAIQGELQCVASLTAYPPAPKPKNLEGVLLSMPTALPGSTATLQVGIQYSVPAIMGNFMPAEYNNNMWANFVNGRMVQAFAGSIKDDDWQSHPDLAPQGTLRVVVNYNVSKGKLYSTPTRHGEVHFIAACGTKLILQAKDGTIFVFDAATLSYISNIPACPTVTP